jgi:hypothetical protein
MPEHIAQHVEALLKEEGFTVDRVTPIVPAHAPEQDDTLTLRIFVKGKHAEWACMIRCFEQSARLLVYSLYPEQVEAALRNRISELICRINYGLILGNFEMDWEDGELRYKTSMDIESIEINRTVLRNLVYGNFHSFELLEATDGQRRKSLFETRTNTRRLHWLLKGAIRAGNNTIMEEVGDIL